MKLAPVASAFYRDNSFAACIMGPIGSGKTTAAALRLRRHALEQTPSPDGVRRSRWVIVRRTGPQLQQTTMKTWFSLFPQVLKGAHQWVSTRQTQIWRYTPKGDTHPLEAEFLFRALDDEKDIANLLSLEVTGVWFNELAQIDSNIVAHAATRTGRYPSAAQGGCKWNGWIADTNPWAATSEFHRMFVVDKPEAYAFFHQPGGLDPDAENIENLPGGREYYVRALQGYKPYDADMYVHSKYGVSRDGKPVYESYNDNVHCAPFELSVGRLTRNGKPFTPIWIGYDNTGRNPAALIGQKTDTGQWRIRYEFCGQGIGLKAHAHALRMFLTEKVPDFQIQRITCDPAGRAKGADELDMRMVIQHEFPGVSVQNARTNEIATRIEAVEGPLRRNVNGAPALLIHPDCKILRDACISKYRYRRVKLAGDERYTDDPEKITPFADAADALQYLMLGGGEGRVLAPAEQGASFKWPAGGQAAITPKPTEAALKRSQGPVFDPRSGSVFNER